jgi:perosamine synthetase
VGAEEQRAVCETLESDWLTAGPRVRQFEADVAKYVHAPHTVAVASATAALRLSLEAMGVGPGVDVLVPTMTFASAAAVVVHLGARPVFVDCAPDTLTMDFQDLERKLSAKSRVVMPMHFAGHPAEVAEIQSLAATQRTRVLEDGAHALSAAYRGEEIGGISEATCFSFYATKTLTTGEGGMIATRNAELARRVRLMAYHGIDRERLTDAGVKRWWRYEVVAAGFKDNMTDIQAAIGVEQLKKAEPFRKARERCANLYQTLLADVTAIRLPACKPYVRHSWHMFVVQLDLSQLRIGRDEFSLRLEEEGVANSVHYLPLHLHQYYRDALGCQPCECPAATAAYGRVLSLPIYPSLPEDDITYVADRLRALCARYGR